MSADNQIEIPQSFMALYVTPGRTKPNAPHEIVIARYGQCEDMACLLTEHAQALAFKENMSDGEILIRCHRGLRAEATAFTEREAAWVILRLAELLGWAAPDLG
jgi:hypothetical protein